MEQQIFNLNWDTYTDHLREMLNEIMLSNESADVTLVCEDKTQFKAHKIVLRACSAVFRSMIPGDSMTNTNSMIYLRGIESPEIKSILDWIYLGQATICVDNLDKFLDVAKSLEIKELNKADYGNEEMAKDERIEQNTENFVMDIAKQTTVKAVNDRLLSKVINQDHQKFQCDQCDRQYIEKKNLNKHIRKSHKRMK